jgi:hypothetical protein
MKTIRAWDDAATKYNENFSFGFGAVVSSANITELPGIIRLASSFKHMDSVYVQPIFLKYSKIHLENLLLKNVNSSILRKCIDEAKFVSDEVGIRIDNLSSLIRQESDELDFKKSIYCRYMWNKIMAFKKTGELSGLCCYLDPNDSNELMAVYNIPKFASPKEIYNSKGFWNLRKDMLNGKLIKYCKNCSLCNTGYNVLSSKELNIDEPFYL